MRRNKPRVPDNIVFTYTHIDEQQIIAVNKLIEFSGES